jgi:HPt (histidine-containing phosphotransfer) domain-containing protein
MIQPNRSQDAILSEFANEPDMSEIIGMFVAEMPEKIEAIRAACEKDDVAALSVLAHRLKGSAGGYGFPTLTDAAAELELAVKYGADLAAVREQVESLVGLCARIRACPVDGDA